MDPSPENTEVRGAAAIRYLMDQGLDEQALTIAKVEDHHDNEALPYGERALSFKEHDMIYVLNRQALRALWGAYGVGSSAWLGQPVRIKPEQHFDEDEKEYWGLALEPLFICQACRREATADAETRLCAWCSLEKKQTEGSSRPAR